MNLPLKTKVSELMNKIRGGTVVSCQLLDTVSISGSFSVLVQFLYEQDAIAYEDFAAENPIYFAGQRAHIKLIQTPSWPIVLSDQQHTRCLKLYNFPTNIKQAQLRGDLRMHKASRIMTIENMRMHKGQVLEVRFSSIKYAEKAYDVLTTNRAYKQCRVTFSRDPCTWPLDTLIEGDMFGAAKSAPLTVARQDDNRMVTSMEKLGIPELPTASRALYQAKISPERIQTPLFQSRWAPGPGGCPGLIQPVGASTSWNNSTLCPSTQEADMETIEHIEENDYCIKETGIGEFLATADMRDLDQNLAVVDMHAFNGRLAAEMATYQNTTLLD